MTTVGTRVFAAGVSNYSDKKLCLRFAAKNAADIVEAFALDDGCAIPPRQMRLVTNEDATRKGILAELSAVAAECSNDDVLVVFFSGHGERLGDEFFLLPWEADPADLPQTAVTSEDLRDALVRCAARGVLVILDCCRGAGFAENADRFFVTLGGREFRLLICASRADQPSFEFGSQKGTIFSRRLVEVLRGEVPIGAHPGAVYFLELSRYLSLKVAEDLETIGQARNAQEPISVGTYAGDPRLFILRKIALDRLEAETPLYSRQFVRRRLRRTAITLAVLLILGLASYYYYLEHSFYVWLEPSTVEGFEGDYLAVYAGDPNLNALGFPHLVRTTDIPVDALPRRIRPGVGLPPMTRLGSDIDVLMFNQLTPQWRSIAKAWEGDAKAALEYGKEFDEDSDLDNDSPAMTKAVDAIGRTAGKDAAGKFVEQLIGGFAPNRDEAGARLVAEWDADEAEDLVVNGNGLLSGGPDDNSDDSVLLQRGFLQGIGAPCSAKKKKALDEEALRSFDPKGSTTGDVNYDRRAPAWFAAILRTGCTVDPVTAAKVVDYDSYETIASNHKFDLVSLFVAPPGTPLVNWLIADIKKRMELLSKEPDLSDEKFEAGRRAWIDLRLVALSAPQSVPQSVWKLLDGKEKGHVRFAAARALIAKSPDHWQRVRNAAAADPWVMAAMADAGIYDESAARAAFVPLGSKSNKYEGKIYHLYGGITRQFMRAVRRHKITQAAAVIHEIGDAFSEVSVKIEAARTLDALIGLNTAGAPASERSRYFVGARNVHLPLLDNERDTSVFRDEYSWAVTNDDGNFAQFMRDFGAAPEDDAELLGRLPLTDFALTDLRSRLNNASTRISSCAVLAMRGTESDLKALLSDKDLHIRQTAESYAVYNPRLQRVLESPELSGFGLQTRFVLRRQMELQRAIVEAMAKLPLVLGAIAPNVLVLGSPEPSPGLMLWAKDLSDGAGTNAIEGELLLDNTE